MSLKTAGLSKQSSVQAGAGVTEETVVHLRAASLADLDGLDSLPPLRPSPSILRALNQLLPNNPDSTDRAWTLVGPYGAGKSTLSVFLAGLLGNRRKSPWIQEGLTALCRADSQLSGPVDEILASPPVVPVLIQGSARPLWTELINALLEANKAHGNALFGQRTTGIRRLAAEPGAASDLRKVLQRASRAAREAGYSGLLILVDEFGRFLDRSKTTVIGRNLAVTQDLAEFCTRPNRRDVRLVLVLHQNIVDYAAGAGFGERADWSKIQGRFRQIGILSEPEDLYSAMAACLVEEGHSHDSASDTLDKEWSAIRDVGPFAASRDEWKQRIKTIYPLHALSAYCLPRLSMLLGQNERTVFSFLLSDEPHGLRVFRKLRARNAGPRLVGLDWLCDYFLIGQVNSFVPPAVRQQLAKTMYALEQVVAEDEMAAQIVKVVGILEVVNSPELRPSEGVIAAALEVYSDRDWRELRQQLSALSKQGVLVERRYANEYRLSSGSDFDLEDAISEAVRAQMSALDPAAVLNEELGVSNIVARRHAFETGTQRVVSRSFVNVPDIEVVEDEADAWRALTKKPDLIIEYIVCTSKEELESAEAATKRARELDHVYVVPNEPLELRDLLAQLAASRRVLETADVATDSIARQEVAVYQGSLRSQLLTILRGVYGPSRSGRWIWKGSAVSVGSERDIQALLSSACDSVFAKSPKISCELVNRHQLSTVSVVAVKKIISGLLDNLEKPGVGFEGNGPEVTIFKAVFEETGWHRQGAAGYELGRPSRVRRMGATWRTMQKFFDSTAEDRRSLAELWEKLSRAPFGIRAGLAPLIIWGGMIERRSECCLYERGTYVPTWSTELYDRFLRAPEVFEVRCVKRESIAEILSRLVPIFRKSTGGSSVEHIGVNDFLHALFSWYGSLPDFAKRTTDVSAEAIRFRQVISSSVDPVKLILTELPAALVSDQAATDSRKTVQKYAKRFKEVVDELSNAYSRLLDQLRRGVAQMLGTQPQVKAIHEELKSLSKRLSKEVTDPVARPLLMRANQEPGEASAWVEALGSIMVGQPPKYWTDQTLFDYDQALSEVHMALRRAERAMVLRMDSGQGNGAWVTITRADGSALDDVVPTTSVDAEVGSLAQAEVRKLTAGLTRDQRRSILLQLTQDLWEE